MAVPTAATYSAAAKVAAHTSFRDLLDSGASAGSAKIRTSADALLATIPLADPCGTVNGTTGQLTLDFPAPADATASGEAAYAELCDSDGDVHLALPCQAGSVAVSGKFVLNTLTVVSGSPVEVISATIG